jgi:hypothetical protein
MIKFARLCNLGMQGKREEILLPVKKKKHENKRKIKKTKDERRMNPD